MKRKPENYIDTGIYGYGDEDIQNNTEKVVKCRGLHKCVNCQEQIKFGDYALVERGFLDRKPVSAYTCIPCLDKWLDEIEKGE